MSFGRCTSKMCLGALGAVFWAAAIASFIISAHVIVTYKHYDSFATVQYALILASLFTFVGVMFLVTGFIGCWAMCRENKCANCSFFFALLLMLSLLIASACLAFTYKGKIEEIVANASFDALDKYGPMENRQTAQVDFMQTEMQCCGLTNFTDWLVTPWSRRNPDAVPKSCCKAGTLNICNGTVVGEHALDMINTLGCFDMWKGLLMQNVKKIAVGSMIFTVALVIGMISACTLCWNSKKETYTSLD